MIKFQLKEAILARGILYPHRYLVKHCDIPHVSATKLLNGKQASLRLKDLTLICTKLNLTPNDILFYQTSVNDAANPNLRLVQELKPIEGNSDWQRILKDLPPAEVEKLRLLANEKLNIN